MDNLEEMNKFLEHRTSQNWIKETDSVNRPVTNRESEATIKIFLTVETSEPILLKLFQKVKKEATFPNSVHKASITLT